MNTFLELNQDELEEIDGGKAAAWWAVFTYINDHWDSWVESFKKCYNSYPY